MSFRFDKEQKDRTFSQIWNESIDQGEERPVTARNRIWASELGKSDLDIYLKLIGTEVSNPFDARARRKFEAGNLFEWIIKLVLIRCGIYKSSQEWISNNSFGIQVSGKLDHLIGGTPRYEEAKHEIEALMLPDMFMRATSNILEYFVKTYPNGLPEQIIEVKSTSSFGIEKVYFTGKGLAGHDLQAFHYAYNKKLPATLLYICRDDLRMAEIPILPDNEELKARYSSKIVSISDFYSKKVEPPKEPEIVWDTDTERFTKNFNVEYSSYLTRNYGYVTPEEFYEKWGSKLESWNRVVGRVKSRKALTDNNKKKLSEMAEMGFDIINLITKYDDNIETTIGEGGVASEVEVGA